MTDPVTGRKLPFRTPEGLPPAKELMAALESFRDWGLGLDGDEQAVVKIAWPYRLDGPNPSPDLLDYILKAMRVVLHEKAFEDHPVVWAEAHRIHMRQLVSSFSSQ